jgi:predicted TPR repeat methyltransferase
VSDGCLGRAYDARTPEKARALYDEWSATYEAEVAANGYATPGRIAAALGTALPDRAAPILDMGCGTGLAGIALRAEGFETVDGRDISQEMIAQARDRSAYRDLRAIAPEEPFAGAAPGDYAAIVACGVIGTGAAPWSLFDACMEALGPEGLFALSLNDHALAEPEATLAVERWEPGRATVILREHGDHLPGIGLRSTVLLLRR